MKKAHEFGVGVLSLAIYMVFSIPITNAYIDPGTGGIIFNSLWSTISGFFGLIVGFLVLRFIKPIIRWFRKAIGKDYAKKKK